MKETEIYAAAVKLWGFEFQMRIMIEKMAELTIALCHAFRNRDSGSIEAVVEELADVEIMLNQMKLIFPSADVTKKEKLERLTLKIIREKGILNKDNWGGTLIGPDHEKAEVIGRVFKKALS